MGFNDHPCFQHRKLSRGCAKLRPSHGQLVEENSSKFQGETPSIQKSDRDVGWGLNSLKTCICTRQNVMDFYSCLVCLGQFNCLSLGDTFGEFASRYPMDFPLGCMHSEVSARFRTSPISACCFLSCILSQAAQTGHWNAACRSHGQCTGVLISAATIPSAKPTGTGDKDIGDYLPKERTGISLPS